MKVFIEADSIAYGKMSGIGHATLELLKVLDTHCANDSSLSVTAIVPRGTIALVEGFGFQNIRVKQLPFVQKYINYALTRTSLPIPMDLYFGRGIYLFPNYKTWYTPFSKSITFVHDVVFKIFPETVNPKNLLYLEANFDRWLRRASRIVTITNASAADISKYFPAVTNKLLVVPLGVDLQQYYRRTSATVTAVQQTYNLPSKYFLFVGNLEPRKNIYNLLCAYEQYAQQNSVARPLVLIGGDGWKNERIIQKIDDMTAAGMSIVRPTEYVADKDLPAIYSGAVALVHWAIHEGFGLPPLQAQACGIPVIAGDIASLREVLDPQTTTFIRPDDITGMTAALQTVDRQNLPAETSDIPPTPYTWNNTLQKLLAVMAMVK